VTLSVMIMTIMLHSVHYRKGGRRQADINNKIDEVADRLQRELLLVSPFLVQSRVMVLGWWIIEPLSI
jgi:hypothetical protein